METLLRRKLLVLLCLCLVVSLPAQAATWLPDIGPVLGAKGELYGATEEESGPYHTYIYEVEMTVDQISNVIVAYTEALKTRGFSAQKKSNPSGAVYYMTYTCDDGVTELAVFVTGNAKELSEGGKGSLWFVLAVPDATDFTLGLGTSDLVEGGTRCIECRGSGRCKYCSGSGRYKNGKKYETCFACNGNGICNICDGEGSY